METQRHVSRVSTQRHVVNLHTFNHKGLTGWMFTLYCLAGSLYTLGFGTMSWVTSENHFHGLWNTCGVYALTSQSWFTATQGLMAIALAFLVITMLCLILYLFVHGQNISLNTTIKCVVLMSFLSFLCMFIGVTVFGVNGPASLGGSLSWSYFAVVIGMIFVFIGMVMAIMQMKKARVILV